MRENTRKMLNNLDISTFPQITRLQRLGALRHVLLVVSWSQ